MNKHMGMLHTTQKLAAFVAIFALVMMTAQGLFAQNVEAAQVWLFDASVTPTAVDAGATEILSFTITNDSSSSADIKAARIFIPVGFTVNTSSLTVDNALFEAGLNGEIRISQAPGGGSDGLAPGESMEVTAEVTNISGSGVSDWTVCAYKNNSFTPAGGADFAYVGGGDCAELGITIVTPEMFADISVVKEADLTNYEEGDTVTYTITVANTGPDTATNVDVTDVLPTGLTFDSANPTSDTLAPNLAWTFASIAKDAQEVIAVTATVDVDIAPTDISNTATAAADETDENLDNNSSTVLVTIDETVVPGPDTARLKIVKNVVGGSALASDWTMSATGGDNTYDFSDSGDVSVAVFHDIEADITYAMSESDVTGYTLTNISCDGGVLVGNDITLVKDEQVSCTFTNTADSTPTGTLEIIKTIVGNDTYSAIDFNYSIDGVGTTTLTGPTTTRLLAVGTYKVVEESAVGFTTAYDNCESISVTDGGTTTCTITNTWIPTCDDGIQNQDETGIDEGGVCAVPTGTLIIEKEVTDGSDTEEDFAFDPSWLEANFVLSHGASSSFELQVGSYSVVELAEIGWTQESAVCTYGNQSTTTPAAIEITEDETVTCVFVNDEDPEEPSACTVQVVSDDTNYVIETDANAFDLISEGFSKPGTWVGGIVDSIAQWIWSDADAGTTGGTDDVRTFQKTFTWNGPVTDAELNIGSDNQHVVYLNGVEIASTTVLNTFKSPVTYTLSVSDIVTGENTLEIAVTNDGVAGSGNPAGLLYDMTVVGNTEVDCTTVPEPYTLTVEITGEGTGSVFSDDENIDCTSSVNENQEFEQMCEMTYPAGTVVDLSAIADEGSNFDNSWTVGAGTCTANNTPCQVTMNSDIDLVAHFGLNTGSTPSGGGGGGGGGSTLPPRCETFSAELVGGEIELNWETRRGYDMSIAADGIEIFTEDKNSIVETGSYTVTDEGQDTFELTVYRGSRNDVCSATIDRLETPGPTPQVLGEQVSAVPLGAADTGAGGSTPVELPRLPLMALALRATRKNG